MNIYPLDRSPESDIPIYSPISISAHSDTLENEDHYMSMDDLTPHKNPEERNTHSKPISIPTWNEMQPPYPNGIATLRDIPEHNG